MAGAVCDVSFLFSVLVCGFPEKLLIYGEGDGEQLSVFLSFCTTFWHLWSTCQNTSDVCGSCLKYVYKFFGISFKVRGLDFSRLEFELD